MHILKQLLPLYRLYHLILTFHQLSASTFSYIISPCDFAIDVLLQKKDFQANKGTTANKMHL